MQVPAAQLVKALPVYRLDDAVSMILAEILSIPPQIAVIIARLAGPAGVKAFLFHRGGSHSARSMSERYLPETAFRGRAQHYRIEYGLQAAAMIHGGVTPDLLGEVVWWKATTSGSVLSTP